MNKLEIATEDDAEHVEFIICARLTRPLILPDNLIDLCSRCGEAIQHRPHIPTKPAKVCHQCLAPDLERHAAAGDLHVMMTQKTAAEVADYLRKKKEN